MDEGPERARTCGVGCLIFGALGLVVNGDAAAAIAAAGGTTEAAFVEEACSTCSRAEKSMSGPKSSSMVGFSYTTAHHTESRGNREEIEKKSNPVLSLDYKVLSAPPILVGRLIYFLLLVRAGPERNLQKHIDTCRI